MRKRATFVVGFSAVVTILAGCGHSGPQALDAPNKQNVDAIRTAFAPQKSASAAEEEVGNPLLAVDKKPEWATLSGTIKINGAAPTRDALVVDKNQDVCMPGGRPVLSERCVVGDNGGLANVLIFLETELPVDDSGEAEPLWVHSQYNMEKHPELQEVIFDQKNCVFLSHVFAARSNQTLKILNSDPIGHNTKLDTTRANSLNASIAENDSVTHVLGAQEKKPFGVSCSIHPWMTAWMISRDSPYFAVTDENGQFTIENIPAGVELKFKVWTVPGFVDGKNVPTLTLNGNDHQIQGRGELLLNLTPGQTHDMAMEISAAAFQ